MNISIASKLREWFKHPRVRLQKKQKRAPNRNASFSSDKLILNPALSLPNVPFVGNFTPAPPPYSPTLGMRAEKLSKGLVRGEDGSYLYYDPQRPLGNGSFGRVFEGLTGDGRLVGVKEVSLLPPKRRADEKPVVSQPDAVQHELDAMRQVESPLSPWKVYVTARRFGQSAADNKVLMVQPLMESDLFNKIDALPNNPVRGLMLHETFEELAKELAKIHASHLGHYDIKPENILLDRLKPRGSESRRFMFADYGLAEDLRVNKGEAGTLDYVAPEALRNLPLSAKADVWSLGVTMLVSLTGFSPFQVPYERCTPEQARHHVKGRHDDWVRYYLNQRVRRPARQDFDEMQNALLHLDRANGSHWTHLVNQLLNPDPHQRPTAAQIAGFFADNQPTPEQKALADNGWQRQARVSQSQTARIARLRERWAADLGTLHAAI